MQSNNGEMFKVHDRTIPNRREQMARHLERVSQELIRMALQARSASEAIREESDGR